VGFRVAQLYDVEDRRPGYHERDWLDDTAGNDVRVTRHGRDGTRGGDDRTRCVGDRRGGWVIMRRTAAVGVVAVLLVAAGLSLGGGAGATSDGGSGDDVESFPTETPSDGDAGTGTATGTADPGPDFAFAVDRIEECGRTCRDVTSTLRNDGGAAATDVTVYTRIYAGNGTDGDVVWEGRERVGSLGAGESSTSTERVELSLADAIAVEGAGGWITVRTTIQSAEETVTVTQRRQVA